MRGWPVRHVHTQAMARPSSTAKIPPLTSQLQPAVPSRPLSPAVLVLGWYPSSRHRVTESQIGGLLLIEQDEGLAHETLALAGQPCAVAFVKAADPDADASHCAQENAQASQRGKLRSDRWGQGVTQPSHNFNHGYI